jgi:type IV secretion system protein TrbL
MAERVLGHIISSGIKVLVLAVITGIGTTLFSQFINAGLGVEPDIQQVMAIALAALTLLGLGIFGPSIANGIVSGGPQLGAGAAAGTAIAAGATIAGGIAGAKLAAGATGSAMAGAATGGARAAGGASGAYAAGAAGKTGRAAAASGLANVAKSTASSAASPLRRAADSLKANYAAGKARTPANAAATGGADGPPAWATAMKRRQAMTQGANMASHTLKGGDSHGGGSGPDISDKS